MGKIVYGDTYFFQFAFNTLPCAYVVGTKNFLPTHIMLSPGTFWNGNAAFNTIIGYRIYQTDFPAKDDSFFATGTYNRILPAHTNIKWTSQSIVPTMYLPWNRPLSMLIEFYGAGLGTISGNVNAEFCIRGIIDQ